MTKRAKSRTEGRRPVCDRHGNRGQTCVIAKVLLSVHAAPEDIHGATYEAQHR